MLDNTWQEETITWSNAPAAETTMLAELGAVSPNTWYEVNLTTHITSDGTYSLRISDSQGGADYSSKEGANAPKMLVALGGATPQSCAGTATATPTPGATNTPTPTNTPGPSPTPTNTLTPSATPAGTNTPTPPAPAAFNNATFVYDGDGKRVKSAFNNNTTTTYFVGTHYEVTNPGTNQTITKYYYAGAQRIAMRTNGTLNYLLGDHLGSTSLTTNASGQIVSELRYKAWGEVRYPANGQNPGPSDYTYTGQYSDSYINLLWYGSRHYDPELGRFIQPDSIVPLASQGVQAWDRYAYVNNSPLSYVDPSGHDAVAWPLIAVFILLLTLPGDTGPYEVSPLNEAVSEASLRFVDPIDWIYTGIECRAGQCSGTDIVLAAAPFANGGMDNAAKALRRALESGKWTNRTESMSDAARKYQNFISGRSDNKVFELGGYAFDGFDASKGVLLEAKNIPENFINSATGEFKPWVSGTDDWLQQAENQINAADGLKINWYFNSEAAKDAMYKLFIKHNPDLLDSIELIHKPMK
ncbi:MAG: Tox-REase-5 domain-containing protein [Anaerolineae bacterium]|nr:Tox-REase-5 domain-containing protein [Anaerolineae bacterium]